MLELLESWLWLAPLAGICAGVGFVWGVLSAGAWRRIVAWSLATGLFSASLAALFFMGGSSSLVSLVPALSVGGFLLGRRFAPREVVTDRVVRATGLLCGLGLVQGNFHPEIPAVDLAGLLVAPLAWGALAVALAVVGWLLGRLGVRLVPSTPSWYPWAAGLLSPVILTPLHPLLWLAWVLGLPAGGVLAKRAFVEEPRRPPKRFGSFVAIAFAYWGLCGGTMDVELSSGALFRSGWPEAFTILVGLSACFAWLAGRVVLWPSRPDLLRFDAPRLGWLTARRAAYRRIASHAEGRRRRSGLDEEHFLFALVGVEELLDPFTGKHTGPSEALEALFERVLHYHARTGVLLDAGPGPGGFAVPMRQLLDDIHADLAAGRYSAKTAARVVRLLEARSARRLPRERQDALAGPGRRR